MRHIGGRDDDIPGMPGNTFIAHDEFRDSFAQHPGFRVGMGMQAGPFPRCRVALNWVLPQFVWRNYPELGTFGRDSRDFKKALVARERRFGSRR